MNAPNVVAGRLLAAAAAAALSAAGLAQAPPGITPEMIATALPLEGAPPAVAGPYRVTSEPAFASPRHIVFRPGDLGPFPSRDTLPVVVWGNGGCAIDSARYAGFFSTIASHGFLVIGTVPEPGAPRRPQNADDLRAAIDWAARENARDGSPLEGRIDTAHVAVMGQSCGEFLSMALGADPRVRTIGVFNAGVQRPSAGGPLPLASADALAKLHGPALLVSGAERDFMTPASLATFEMIDHVPAFYGARHHAGHTATVDHPGGGEYANVASGWLLWQFKRDRKAARMFVGRSCDLCTNPNWDVRAKGFTGARVEGPSATFDRGSRQQAWQAAGYKAVLATCQHPPQPFAIPGAGAADASAPPPPPLPATHAIAGVLAAGQQWKVVWSWEGNNVDGPIAGDRGTILFANNDAGSVMQLDPSTGLAKILYGGLNTAGAISRSRNGALVVAERGLGSGIEQLEPARRMLASAVDGEPLDCLGGVLNDLTADAKGGVYFSVTGAAPSGVFYADPKGVVSRYGTDVALANGIILSPDERTLYVTSGPAVLAFDVRPDGSLANQREFGRLRGGEAGDGSAVDQQGRLYVATGRSVDVFAPDGTVLGTIPGPQGLHGTFFGGRNKRTLFGIVFYGAWGTPSARNEIIAIPTIAQGYTGRAK